VDAEAFLRAISRHLQSPDLPLRKSCITTLRLLVQKHASVFADLSLDKKLFMMFDRENDAKLLEDIKILLITLLEELAPDNINHWLQIAAKFIMEIQDKQVNSVSFQQVND
jgi:hypothetical protein